MKVVLPLLVAVGLPIRATSQPDFSGEWTAIANEANATDPQRGELGGLPLNREGVRRAAIWDPEIESLPVWQCAPPVGMALRLDAAHLAIRWQAADGSGGLGAFWVGLPESVGFPIFLDRRAHPPAHARHTPAGYSTGTWLGDVLRIDTTHLQEGHYRRNGAPQSDRARFTELLIRRTFRGEEYLTWVVVAEDPIYLTEPLVRGSSYRREPIPVTETGCGPTKPVSGTTSAIPAFLSGENEGLDALALARGLPPQIAAEGAATMYPEYRTVIDGWRRSGASGSESGEVP